MPAWARLTRCLPNGSVISTANPVSGEVLFIRQISAKSSDAHPAARAACVLDLKRNYIERFGLARIYCYASEEDRPSSCSVWGFVSWNNREPN